MIGQLANPRGTVASELLDLNRTGKIMLSVSLLIPKFAPGTSSEVWRTSKSGY